jgi:glycosyltransferase involved in cell wall biosynthesis
MNIWYAHHYAGGPGIGRFFRPWELAREWAKLGHHTTVFVADFHHLLDKTEGLPAHQIVDGVSYVALASGRYKGNGLNRILNMMNYTRSLWALRKRVGRDLPKPDGIIVSSPHPFAVFAGHALAKRFNAKLIFEVRDLWPLSVTEINGTSKWHPFVWLTAFTERYAYRHADVVASLLPGVENYMKERSLAYRNFIWVPNGLTVESMVPLEPRSERGITAKSAIAGWQREARQIVVYAGALGKPNAIDLLLSAAKILADEGNAHKFAFLIIGDGDKADELRAQAAALPNGIVHFAGRLTKPETLWMLKASDIAYGGLRPFDAVFKYGISPNKLLDYILIGLPVVLPAYAYRDPITETGGGVAVRSGLPQDIAEAIAKLADMSKAERMAKAKEAQERALQLFGYAGISDRYAQAMQKEAESP